MKTLFLSILLISTISNLFAQEKIRIIEENELLEILNKKNDSTYVVNFWATWCAPCMREMPILLDFAQANKNKKVKLILISLDFPKHIESKVIPFVEENEVEGEVVVFDTPPGYKWIDAVDSAWNGGIPATIVFNSTKRIFHGNEIHSMQEIDSLLITVLNN